MQAWRKPIHKSYQGEPGVVYYFNSEVLHPKEQDVKYFSRPFTLNPIYGKTIEANLKKMTDVPKDVKADLLKKREALHEMPDGRRWIVWISDTPVPADLMKPKKIDQSTGREVSPGGIIL